MLSTEHEAATVPTHCNVAERTRVRAPPKCLPLHGLLRTLAVAGGGDRHDAQLVVGQLVDRRVVLAIPVRRPATRRPHAKHGSGCGLRARQAAARAGTHQTLTRSSTPPVTIRFVFSVHATAQMPSAWAGRAETSPQRVGQPWLALLASAPKARPLSVLRHTLGDGV